ncbi:MAG: DUF86 domain-containing protein [Acidobacteria bacterium]|nr:DUF86 domain-containing protein [Acidobacteriota bacterium]
MRDVKERLLDIHEAIVRIEKYSAGGREALELDELIQTWILHHLQIIGEAIRALPPSFMNQHPEVPWSKAIGLRHILVHHYFGIDIDAVWSVVERDLPALKIQIDKILHRDSETG